ncbi:hypothetical protein MUA90_09325 [Staphylococcus sp. IVB6181]|nr:hypothetical protein MUA90_09325 [Staphylococcus sp. IVB6181]
MIKIVIVGMIMFENQSEFPDENLFTCPPLEANDAENLTMYKFNDRDTAPSKYLEPMINKGKKDPDNDDQRCRMFGHSVYLDYKFIADMIGVKSKISKGTPEKWRYVFEFQGSSSSKILSTPSNRYKNHHTYWHFGNDNIQYKYVCAVDEIRRENNGD